MARRFNKTQLQRYKLRLLELRGRLRHDMNSLQTAALTGGNAGQSRMSIHMAEAAGEQFEQECNFRLSEKEQSILDQVKLALNRLEQGTYGTCEATGQPISLARLEAIPYTPYCVEYARQQEKLTH